MKIIFEKFSPSWGLITIILSPPVNYLGGITVLWNNRAIHASVLLTEHRAIHILVHDI